MSFLAYRFFDGHKHEIYPYMVEMALIQPKLNT